MNIKIITENTELTDVRLIFSSQSCRLCEVDLNHNLFFVLFRVMDLVFVFRYICLCFYKMNDINIGIITVEYSPRDIDEIFIGQKMTSRGF